MHRRGVRVVAVALRFFGEAVAGEQRKRLLLRLLDVSAVRDDPNAGEQDRRPEADETELEPAEHVPLVVVDEARDDRREVVGTEGERADEVRSKKSESAVEVEELDTGLQHDVASTGDVRD